ncbi:MAG: transporter substrate-binding protein [Hyphomicrobiales bacterium]|nr:transporter substrate-binding protein [Hyphomicrobiales bacterium]
MTVLKGLLRALRLAVPIIAASAPAIAQDKIKFGVTRTMIVGAAMTSLDKGYFRDAGLDVDVTFLDASASAVVLLATNQLQVVEGGVAASFFNGVRQGLPVRIAMDNVSTPVAHWLVLRTDLKDEVRTVRDLRGRNVGSNAPASIGLYEIAKILETGGLTLKDVNVKLVGFPQMEAAFATKAVDAFIMPSPWSSELPRKGAGVQFVSADAVIKPAPFVLSVTMFNTDWAARNPDQAKRFFGALLLGARDYCDAYHGGPNRDEIANRLVANGVGGTLETLQRIQWTARTPDGRINPDSLMDIQRWFVEQGVLPEPQPIEKVLDQSLVTAAAAGLPAFRPSNPESKLEGCR